MSRVVLFPSQQQAPPTADPHAGLSVCKECHKPIDMKVVGSVRIVAHGRTFCSMKCADTWENNPDNAEAVSASYEEEKKIRYRWEP